MMAPSEDSFERAVTLFRAQHFSEDRVDADTGASCSAGPQNLASFSSSSITQDEIWKALESQDSRFSDAEDQLGSLANYLHFLEKLTMTGRRLLKLLGVEMETPEAKSDLKAVADIFSTDIGPDEYKETLLALKDPYSSRPNFFLFGKN